MSYEFSKELGHNAGDEEMTRRTRNFINSHNIRFNGEKVYLVIDGIVVKTLNIKNSNSNINKVKNDNSFSNCNYIINLKLEDNSMIEITLKEYLLGVLPNNLFPFITDETLKSLSILYRTYVFYMMQQNKYVDAYSNFANYKSIYYYKMVWLKDFDIIKNRLENIINQTDSLFLTYNSKYILPFMHFSNTGKTLSNSKYSYLSKVNSLWDLASPYYVEINEYDYNYLSKLFNTRIDNKCNFKILELDNSLIKKISINNKIFTGEEIKNMLNLKSLDLTFILNKSSLKIISRGCGNFLGLSVFGANELAKNGCSYIDIIKYYFPKVKICKYIKELSK